MSIDHRIEIARDHFKITKPEDWCEIRPEWITKLHGVKHRTLDLIRLYLAARGLTLKDDATPTFWQQNLQTASIGGQIALIDNATTEEFTILVDSKEKHPWTFQGLGTAEKPLIVPYRWKTLGPSHGDYSIAGCEAAVHIERKSLEDALGTFLSHGDRRDRWLSTLAFLAEIPAGAVIIEATFGQCIANIKPRGKRSQMALRSEFTGSVLSWSGDYMIPFWFMDSRRLAERFAYRFLKRGWRLATEQRVSPLSDEQVIAELC
jgi:hypothetical protein